MFPPTSFKQKAMKAFLYVQNIIGTNHLNSKQMNNWINYSNLSDEMSIIEC